MTRTLRLSPALCLLSILVLTACLPPVAARAQIPAPSVPAPATTEAKPEPVAPAAPKSPLEETRRKMGLSGVIDGTDWSVSLSLVGTGLGSVLDFVAEAARAKPREINMNVDRAGIAAAGISLDDPIDLEVKGVSLQEALGRALGDKLDYFITPTGRVIVTAKAGVRDMERRWNSFVTLVRPTAAAADSNKRLHTCGVINGSEWSITLSLTGTMLGSALDFLAEAAGAKPRSISLAVDQKALSEADCDAETPMDLQVKDVSMAEALQLLLRTSPEVVVAVMDDGTALVTTRKAVKARAAMAAKPVSVAATPEAAATMKALAQSVALDLTNAVSCQEAVKAVTAAIEATKGATKITFVLPTDAESQAALERKVLLYAKDWSVGELLVAVLPTEFGYAVEADGRVKILLRAKTAAPAENTWAVPQEMKRPQGEKSPVHSDF
jgi:hypothetical protein